jgi:hypothetical protein
MLDVTARLLEEVLENALPEEDQGEALPEDLLSEGMSLPCSEMLM